METSALQSVNIEKGFKIMVDEIYGKFYKQMDEQDGDNEIDGTNFVDLNSLRQDNRQKEKKCC